jgi:hypothetical protein
LWFRNFRWILSVRSVVVRCGLILAMLAALAVGCFGGESGTTTSRPTLAAASGTLRVAVTLRRAVTPTQIVPAGATSVARRRHYSLTCGPAGGTMPTPTAACAALDDLATHHRRPRFCSIIQPQGGGALSTASITGTFAGRPFRLRLTNESWCGEPDPVMRDFWVLSTFPCSTVVIHSDNSGGTYADWAHKSGCAGTA